MFPEMRSMNLKTFSKLFLILGFWILINRLATKLPHWTTFDELCDLLRADLLKQETRMRRTVYAKRVGVGVWRLATGNSFRTCGLQFGIGTSTAKQVCYEFERALCRRINLFIKFPNTPAEIKAVMDEFEKQFHFPQIVGAIDGSHIEIKSPVENHEDYFNRKHYYCVNLQAIVDSELLFRHVAVGFPGCIHDSPVLQLSGLLDMANNRQILTAPTRNINGVDVRPMFVGDSAYPLSNWLIKPFPDRGGLSGHERAFNKKLGAMRSVVERTFGLLQNRWRITLKKNEQDLANVPQTVTAACILHNFCPLRGDNIDGDGDDGNGDRNDGNETEETENGQTTRETIIDYMADEGCL